MGDTFETVKRTGDAAMQSWTNTCRMESAGRTYRPPILRVEFFKRDAWFKFGHDPERTTL